MGSEEKLRKKKEKADLIYRMTQMVNEANSLRDEAAEKMYDVPKGYELLTTRKMVRSGLTMGGVVLLGLGGLWLVGRALEGDFVIMACIFTLALGCAMMATYISNHRPYKIEENEQEYCINAAHCEALEAELKRLKAGIAQYDQEYEERKEYIQKFEDFCPEVNDWGRLLFTFKAGNFHARLKIRAGMDEVDCRLDFDEDGYKRLTDTIDWFNKNC